MLTVAWCFAKYVFLKLFDKFNNTYTKYIHHTISQSACYYLSGVFMIEWRKQIRLKPDRSDIEDAMLTAPDTTLRRPIEAKNLTNAISLT